MLTTTPEAIVMVLEALRRTVPHLKSEVERQLDAGVNMTDVLGGAGDDLVVACDALEAWDRRERLRDDAQLRELLGGYAPVSADLDRLCDIVEARLFGRGAGTDTKEGT